MIFDPLFVAMATAIVSMLIYVEGLRPLLVKGIQRLKSQWHMRQSARLTDAEARGYGWAWGAVMVENISLEHVEATIDSPFCPGGETGKAFDRGVSNAIGDIDYYQSVSGKEPE